MRKFCINTVVFLLPILTIAVSAEILLRHIPNDYVYKKNYLDKNSDSLEVLVLGSSHAYRGINPQYFQYRSFNAAYHSQTLIYDYEILKKYEGHFKKLKYIVLSLSYFSLNNKLENSMESWRLKNYLIYYGMWTSHKPADYFEITSNTVKVNIDRLNSYYLQQKRK